MSNDLKATINPGQTGDQVSFTPFWQAEAESWIPAEFYHHGPAVRRLASPASGVASSGSSGSTSVSGSSGSGSAAAPAWIASLDTASIAADMAAADIGGIVTAAGLTKLLTDLDGTLSSTSKLTSAEFADLKTIAANLNNGLSTSGYLTYVFDALVDGNAANANWTGGAAKSVALGNLAVGSNATQLSELIGKWFLGADLPSSTVDMSGYKPFSVTSSVVANPLFGAGGPSMSDINQGYLGDCYFLSSCAEVANQDSADISSMFTNNGNGTYGVRFYVDGVAQYVTVNMSLADGGNEFNHATNVWASLAEKAYAQLQAGGLDTGNNVNYGNSYSTIGNGGMPANALEAITGATSFNNYYASGGSWADYGQNAALTYTSYAGGISTANVLNALVADLGADDDVVLCSETNATLNGKDTLIADHAMSIYGYDAATGDLEIRNPWGSAAGQYWDTTFEVSLSTLLSDGDMITADNAGVSGAHTAATGSVSASASHLATAIAPAPYAAAATNIAASSSPIIPPVLAALH